MINDVVKYHNDLNTVVMRKWTSEEMNLFFSIISKSRDEGTKLMKFNADELRDIASKDLHLDRWSQTMRSVADKVVDLKYYERTKHSYSVMNLFSYFSVDERNRTIEVEVSSKFEYIINKLEVQFTKYELKEFTSIRSTYAKTAYRLLKQWRTVGHKEFSIDEFKLLLDMPASYKSSEIDRAVIKPILNQLSPYFEGLKVKKIKSNKRGNPVLGYEFIWNPEMTESYVPNKFNKPKHKQKSKSNVPSWSNADYVNTTSEEKKAELERKKKEMLARLDNELPRVLPGQMDMFEE